MLLIGAASYLLDKFNGIAVSIAKFIPNTLRNLIEWLMPTGMPLPVVSDQQWISMLRRQ